MYKSGQLMMENTGKQEIVLPSAQTVKQRQESDEQTRLITEYSLFLVKNSFAENDIVCWKSPSLKNKKKPQKYGIVIQVLPEPMCYTTAQSNSCNFREPLDILIGVDGGKDGFLIIHVDSRRLTLASEEHIAVTKDLLDKASIYKKQNDFKVGQLVKWKPGMKNRSEPKEHHFGVITKIHDPPIINSFDYVDCGSAQWGEKLTISIGIFIDGIFLEFAFDGSRFEAVNA